MIDVVVQVLWWALLLYFIPRAVVRGYRRGKAKREANGPV